MLKDLSKWDKQELQAYLIHHNLKKVGLLLRHMHGYRLILNFIMHIRVVDAIIANVRKSGYERRAATPPLKR